MAIMSVTVEGTYFNQQILNTFYYQSSGTLAATTLSYALLNSMGFVTGNTVPFSTGTVAGDWQDLISDQYTFTSALAQDMYSDTDFYGAPIISGTTGIEASEALSPAMAFGFRTSRSRRSVRRGRKSFVGVVEFASGPGGAITPDSLVKMDALAVAMAAPLTYSDEGNQITFSPVVLGRQKPTDPNNPTNNYRFFPTEAEQLMHIADSFVWEPYQTVRTQTSRQYGRGI